MSPSRKPRNLHEQFAFSLHDTSRIWRNRLNERFKPLGLRQLKWLVLGHLWRAPEGLVQRELAERVGMEGAALVRVLDGMEAEGLIQRCECPQDRRAKIVRLGKKADPVLRKVLARAQTLREEIMQGIAEQDVRTALKVLEEIRHRLEHA